jgi:hypothetical protein
MPLIPQEIFKIIISMNEMLVLMLINICMPQNVCIMIEPKVVGVYVYE